MSGRQSARNSIGLLTVALLVAACGGSSSSGGTADAKSRSITVFAAASLTNVFAAEAKAYTAKSGVKVTFSFAGSQDLVAQIKQGAPADVLATADQKTMQSAVTSGETPRVFAHNTLVVVTAPGNPKHITSMAGLTGKGVIVVLAAATVPAGKYAEAALASAHVVVHPKSLEDNVRGVLTKVELGEADAGIVYVTDARSAGNKVASVPVADSPIATYPAVALKAAGQGFVDFLVSADGQAILRAAGFQPAS